MCDRCQSADNLLTIFLIRGRYIEAFFPVLIVHDPKDNRVEPAQPALSLCGIYFKPGRAAIHSCLQARMLTRLGHLDSAVDSISHVVHTPGINPDGTAHRRGAPHKFADDQGGCLVAAVLIRLLRWEDGKQKTCAMRYDL